MSLTSRNRNRRNANANNAASNYYSQLGVTPLIAAGVTDADVTESTTLVPREYKQTEPSHYKKHKKNDNDDENWFSAKNVLICLLFLMGTIVLGGIIVGILYGVHELPPSSSNNAALNQYGNTLVTYGTLDIEDVSLCVTNSSNATTTVLNFTVEYPSYTIFNLTAFIFDISNETGIPLDNITACGTFTNDTFEDGGVTGGDPGTSRRRLLSIGNTTGSLIVQIASKTAITSTLVSRVLLALSASLPNVTTSALSVITISITSR